MFGKAGDRGELFPDEISDIRKTENRFCFSRFQLNESITVKKIFFCRAILDKVDTKRQRNGMNPFQKFQN